MTIDLVSFYTRHHARLRKWLPETFLYYCDTFALSGRSGEPNRLLTDAEASIFLEHAARRALEEERCRLSTWRDGSVRIDHPETGAWAYASSVHLPDSHLVNLAAALDTLFPEEQPNV